MKKIVGLLAIIALVFGMMFVVACDNGNGNGNEGGVSDPGNLPPEGDETPTEGVLFEGSQPITWSDFCMIEGAKFTGDEPKTIEVTYNAVYSDYINIKINAGYEGGLGTGILTGGTFNADDAGAITEGLAANGTTGAVFTYKPTKTEWTAIKTNGFGMNGNGAVITKVILK